MSNKRDLKAYVRYDGNGRVIAGSLILQRFKPKVGNWQEIDAYECCNFIFTTTTTSTTSIPTTTTTTTTLPLNIGELAEGGYVAYILQDGDPGYDPDVQHGLIVNLGESGNGLVGPLEEGWGCRLTSISGAGGTVIGTGFQNTVDILAGCSTIGIAAYVATNLNDYGCSDEGYTDWYLPSNDELVAIWNNKDLIGLSMSPSTYIWSSTENSSSSAYYINQSGDLNTEQKDLNTFYIWAVRSF